MTDTVKVDVVYRPLRIGWAVRSNDAQAIRKAVRFSHALWGGRFNPILAVDREPESRKMVDLYRLDAICAVGDSPDVKAFVDSFPHLIHPYFGESVFVKQPTAKDFCWLLDICNTVAHWGPQAEWKNFFNRGARRYTWHPNDPLADVFLMQFGELPTTEEVGFDYLDMVKQNIVFEDFNLEPDHQIPADMLDHPSLASIGRYGINRHYRVRSGWDTPGFFLGNALDPNDLVTFWNIRACDIPLLFVDQAHLDRIANVVPEFARRLTADSPRRGRDWERRVGIWSRHDVEGAESIVPGIEKTLYGVGDHFWSGGAILPPIMHLGESSTLGVMGNSSSVPRVNFALTNKPFCSDLYFSEQHLVASVSLVGGLYGDEQHNFDVPFVPELNEFYARTMHFQYDKLRIEPESIGLIIGAANHDSFLYAMPVADLVKRIFALAGFESSISDGGRIVRQLLTQVGGLQGARVFKVPGARRLLKQYGLADTFSRKAALDAIRDKSPENPNGTFSAHTDLFLGPRSIDSSLTPPDVFAFMVCKGLFRIGADLRCEKCDIQSWVPLDALKQNMKCELCGHSYDATKQLIDVEWRYRRSGVIGRERHAQGSVPVALALQQFGTAFRGMMHESMYSPSLDVRPIGNAALPSCEVDFVWIMNGNGSSKKSSLVLAECKDQGPIRPDEFQRDVDNLRQIADAFSTARFDTFILFVKLAPFSQEEIAMARTLNDPHRRRVILLTARELEPYRILERLEAQLGKNVFASSPRDLADVTASIYFDAHP